MYAAHTHNKEPDEMGLGVDAGGSHYGWCRRDTLLQRELPFHRVPLEARSVVQWQADAETAIAIAGPLAEFRHRHRSQINVTLIALTNAGSFLRPHAFDSDGDFQRIRHSLEYVSAVDPLARLKAMIDVADTILAANWSKVCGLSRLLLERGLLEVADLQDWFSQHPACRHHTSGSQ